MPLIKFGSTKEITITKEYSTSLANKERIFNHMLQTRSDHMVCFCQVSPTPVLLTKSSIYRFLHLFFYYACERTTCGI